MTIPRVGGRGPARAVEEDASSKAREGSPLSRLHANAVLRLSSSASTAQGTPEVATPYRVESGGEIGVVVAMRAHRVRLTGLPELFGRVPTNRLEQPITRTPGDIFGRHKRLVDQQRHWSRIWNRCTSPSLHTAVAARDRSLR